MHYDCVGLRFACLLSIADLHPQEASRVGPEPRGYRSLCPESWAYPRVDRLAVRSEAFLPFFEPNVHIRKYDVVLSCLAVLGLESEPELEHWNRVSSNQAQPILCVKTHGSTREKLRFVLFLRRPAQQGATMHYLFWQHFLCICN